MEALYNAVLALIRQRREGSLSLPYLVAIDGRCASGKSTLAAALAKEMNCPLLHMDDFFLRPSQRTPERLTTPGENVDHERFLEEVLLPLKEGKGFFYRPFSCHTQELGEPVWVSPSPLALIEGSYAHHPSLRDHYDLRILLDVSSDEQIRRILKRNGEEICTVFREKWIPLEEAYFAACDVSSYAHAVFQSP